MPEPVAKAALERALDQTEDLVLFYQPIHDALDGRLYAAEALLRQRRQNGEIREAGIITAAAEKSPGPLLFELDNVLVKQAYTEVAHWPPEVRLNVNLSPREFQEGNVIERLTELITSCGIDTGRINLEITETSYIEHPEETMEVLDAIKGCGVELWLDDFGTGHSSIEHVQHFPLDGLKLPGAFVRGLPDDERSRAIVRNVIQLAHDLGLRVIAEEVEHESQRTFLLEHRCDYIQGFLFSGALEADTFRIFAAAQAASGRLFSSGE